MSVFSTVNVKLEAVRRVLEAEGDDGVAEAAEKLARIVKRYKKYERTDADRPPSSGTMWSPRHGFLRVAQGVHFSDYGIGRVMTVGLQIGEKFALPKDESDRDTAYQARKSIVAKVKDEARKVLADLQKQRGGHIADQYGTAHSLFGWVAP